MSVIATAGHVDHGKSTLVRALTGIDPDRWAEEKQRGLTIDLGFAPLRLPSGAEVSIVDVPGHVRFLRNMLAGVGAVDACLLVVAANEGWKPQTEEHLRILELLGITRGIVVLTKVEAADRLQLAGARSELSDRLAKSSLNEAPVIETDALRGHGMAELVACLEDLASSLPPTSDQRRPRLWIDRSFAVRGAGTVVTGTLAGGSLALHDTLEVVPGGQPDHRPLPVRVRGLQSHNEARPSVGPGHRVAVNLVDADRHLLSRGQALVRPGQWAPTRTFDAELSVLAGLDRRITRRGAYHAYLGSAEVVVRVRVLGAAGIEPGTTGLVRLHLPRPLPLLPGDRYILRDSGRAETVGGGEVLDVAPVLPAAKARPDRQVSRVVSERGWVEPEVLERLTGEHLEPTLGRWVVDPMALEQARAALRRQVAESGVLGIDVAALSERQRDVLASLEDVSVSGGRAVVDAGVADQALRHHPYLGALERNPFAPPQPKEAGVGAADLRVLQRAGLVVNCDGLYFAARSIETAKDIVEKMLVDNPSGLTTSELRQALGTTRKYALPLLSHLDAEGITRRQGDLRVAGPGSGSASAHKREPNDENIEKRGRHGSS